MSLGENTGLFLNSGFSTQTMCDKQLCRRRNACWCTPQSNGTCMPSGQPPAKTVSQCNGNGSTCTSTTSQCTTSTSHKHSSSCVSNSAEKAVVAKLEEDGQTINPNGDCELVRFDRIFINQNENWDLVQSCYRIRREGIYMMTIDIQPEFIVPAGVDTAGAELRVSIEEVDNVVLPLFRRALKVMLTDIESNLGSEDAIYHRPLHLQQCLEARNCPIEPGTDSMQVGNCIRIVAQIRNVSPSPTYTVKILGEFPDCGEGTVFEQRVPTSNVVIQRVGDIECNC